MQLTDWLVVIFIVAIVLVLLDGVRRKLGERRNRVVLKLDRNLPPGDFDEELLSKSELPNGGARTLVRDGDPAPTLRTLKTPRKPVPPRTPAAPRTATAAAASGEEGEVLGAVPVLMDTVELEEEHIEHANVFADTTTPAAFALDEFRDDEDPALAEPMLNPATAALAEAEEFTEGLDEENEEDLPMLREEVTARKQPGYPGYREADMLAGRDDDDYEDDDEYEDDEEDEDDDDEDFDELNEPGDYDEDDDEEDEDDEYDDEEDEDLDEEDDEYDDEEEDGQDDEEDEDDDLDELEGYPEDDWGAEEEQDALVDDYENEPVLLQDTYSKAASHFSRMPSQPRIEPGFGEAQEFSEEELNEDFSAAQLDAGEEQQAAAAEPIKPIPVTRRPAPPPVARTAPEEKRVPGREEQGELFRDEPKPKSEGFRVPSFKMSVPKVSVPKVSVPRIAMPKAAAPVEPEPAPEPVAEGPREVIIINVMARSGQAFYGDELLPVLQQQGLRLGDMSIFHRHGEARGRELVMFSMANMVKPGTFDLAGMNEFTTPGVSFFLQLPNRLGNMESFENMLGAATALRDALDGELKDENRSVFTRQTVEHCRQRVRDFELSLLARKP